MRNRSAAPLHILLLITQLELAGAQKSIFELARGMAHAGHQVVVVTCYDKGCYLRHFTTQYGVEVISLAMKSLTPEPWFRRVWRAILGSYRLIRLLRQRRIQILQSYTHYSNWLGPLAGWSAGVAHCVTSQRGPLKRLPPWAMWLDRTLNNSPLVDKMVAVSYATLAECRANGIRPDKLLVIRNGIDFAQYIAPTPTGKANHDLRMQLGLSATDRVVLTVARLHPQKGHHTLQQAAQYVVARLPDVKFVWVGEGELLSMLVHARAELGLEHHIMMVGAQAHVRPYYGIADLFVLASHWEGMPNVLLEAAALGLPIVATDVGGVREIIPDDGGVLIPPNCPQALAEAILDLLNDPTRGREMGRRASCYVEETFSQSATLQAYLQFYQELMDDG